ncbi:hypothetical protein [Burkholderia cepacia]|uniref:hypothetical protein n=1 Tax=Burkholderia cepacia TaxID=292 RepID=UPI001CF47505|nr:hypothetical protein [Burkholderia cepacia]MCA7940600.1 hypothetical protein [Burkholderia cepacia]
MADYFEGTSDQVFEQLMSVIGSKARVSLGRIKAACDKIEAMRGLMNYSRVAAVTVELFGSPRPQTIQNNRHLKAYIATRISEYRDARSRGRSANFSAKIKEAEPRYPATDLDSKTRLHIDFLRQDNERLQKENKRLAQLLEQASLQRPFSLTEALSCGPTEGLGLDIKLPVAHASMPTCLLDALEVILRKQPAVIQVQRRGQSVRLACEVDGVLQTLLSPAQWNEAVEWMSIQRH